MSPQEYGISTTYKTRVATEKPCKALANKLSGSDLDSGTVDLAANFNVNLGKSGCLSGVFFYLGLDNNHGNNIDLVTTILHEFAHGLGFQTFTDGATGAQLAGHPSIWDDFLLDTRTNKTWSMMTDSERMASAVDTGHLVWNGGNVTAAIPQVLRQQGSGFSGADPQGRGLMFSPSPYLRGSSVSHWDTSMFPNQLLEPVASLDLTHEVTPPQDLTFPLLKDLGWAAAQDCGTPARAALTAPTPGSGLSGSTVTFTWSAGNCASAYWLDVGTIQGQGNIFGQNVGLVTSKTVSGIPTPSIPQLIYVRLWTMLNGTWQVNDYTYTSGGGGCGTPAMATMTTPVPGSTLGGSTVTFTWSAGCNASAYWLDVGTIQGQGNILGQNVGLVTSKTVSGIPTPKSMNPSLPHAAPPRPPVLDVSVRAGPAVSDAIASPPRPDSNTSCPSGETSLIPDCVTAASRTRRTPSESIRRAQYAPPADQTSSEPSGVK